MNTQCSVELLESALAGNLPAEVEATLHRHLEECEECSAELEQMAGGPSLCEEAAALLRGDELDETLHSREEWSDIDFTVDHLEPSSEQNVLGTLGGYDVLEIIGRGGMGVVLKGYDRALKRCVAIKVLAPHLAHSSLARKRFAREAQAAAAVVNPHVIAIHQVQPSGRLPFLVMPLIAGESLAGRLIARGTLELEEILRIGMQAADGLAAAHEQGLVHRDVKPANVLLEKGVERAVLTDFGLARAADDIAMTRWGIIAGTPEYMSPEQARGEQLDARSDLFSLGCMMYEMATGVSPFRSESVMATLRRLVDDKPRAMRSHNPELPTWFVEIVERLLEKDPSRRFSSAREVSDLLEGCLAHVQQPANVPLPPTLAKPNASRRWTFPKMSHKAILVLTGALACGLLGVFLALNKDGQSAGPNGAHIGGANGSVMVVHDEADNHYAFFYLGEFDTSSSGAHNARSRTWTDEGSIKLPGDKTFGYRRESANPFHLKVNGKEYDLRQGRVFELQSDGSLAQIKLFPPLKSAKSPEALAKLIESTRGLNDQPVTAEKLRLQLEIAQSQLRDLRKTHAPEHELVVQVEQTIVTLQQKIKSLGPLSKAATANTAETPSQNVANTEQPAVATSGVPAATPGIPTDTAPQRKHHFANVTTGGHDVVVACSPDGNRIAIADRNPTMIMHGGGKSSAKDNWKPSVKILDAETGKVLVTLKLSTEEEDAVLAATERVSTFEATALAFSSDGNVIAVGTSIGQIKLFNAQTGELIRSLDDEPSKVADKKTPENWKSLRRAIGSVASLAFSPDGSLLATCGSSFADFSNHFDGVERMGFRPTGPGRLKVWDVATGALKHDLAGHTDEANAVAFSPDGHFLASAGRWSNETDRFGNGVIIWNPRTGEQIHRLIRSNASGGTRTIAFSPDSKLLVVGTQRFDNDKDLSTGGVGLVHVSSGIEEWLITVPGWAKPLAFLPDGKSIAVLCGGKSIRFLEAATGTLQHEIKPSDGNVRWSDFTVAPGGSILAVGGTDKAKNASIEVWSTPGGETTTASAVISQPRSTTNAPRRVLHVAAGKHVGTIACSPDGKLIAIADGSETTTKFTDGTGRVVRIWEPSVEIVDAESGKIIVALPLFTGDEKIAMAESKRIDLIVSALAFSPDGTVVAVGTSVGQVKLFNPRTGEPLSTLDDEKARLADKKLPENLKSFKRAMGNVEQLQFSNDGSLLAMCGSSFADLPLVQEGTRDLSERRTTAPGRLKVWDAKTATLKHDLVGHSEANSVAFAPDGNSLACAGRWEGNGGYGTGVIIWNLQTAAKIRAIETKANGSTRAVAYSPDGKLIVFCSHEFDRDEEGKSLGMVTLARAGTGIVEWQHYLDGWAMPAAFASDGQSVAVLWSGHAMQFFETATGSHLPAIRTEDDPQVKKWDHFSLAQQGNTLVLSGIDVEKEGFVEVWKLDGVASPPADSAPKKK